MPSVPQPCHISIQIPFFKEHCSQSGQLTDSFFHRLNNDSCDKQPLLRNSKGSQFIDMPFAASSKYASAEALTQSKLFAKSLFWKILPISPFVPIFCPDHSHIPTRKSFATKILQNSAKKKSGGGVSPETGLHSQCDKITVAPDRPRPFPESREPEAGSLKPEAGKPTSNRGVKYQSNP